MSLLREFLEYGLNNLRQFGWIQQSHVDRYGVCMRGSMPSPHWLRHGHALFPSYQCLGIEPFLGDEASDQHFKLRVAAENLLESVIAELYPDFEHPTVPSWNDKPGRTFEEVEAIFEKAILKADEIYE